MYQVEYSLSLPLDPLITLSSSNFTQGKIASECDVTFEWYRITFAAPGFYQLVSFTFEIISLYSQVCDIAQHRCTIGCGQIICDSVKKK